MPKAFHSLLTACLLALAAGCSRPEPRASHRLPPDPPPSDDADIPAPPPTPPPPDAFGAHAPPPSGVVGADARPPSPPPFDHPPDVVGASVEGLLERRRANDGTSATHLLRGARGEVLYLLLETAPPPANPEIRLGPHEGQRVHVTGIVIGSEGNVPIVSVRSLVVTRGGEFDRVIAAIGRLRCADAAFSKADSYRLDAQHNVREARFPVHVQTGAGLFTVWVRRVGAPEGYAVDEVFRASGKVYTTVCKGAR